MHNKKIYNLSRYVYKEIFEEANNSEVNFKSWITYGSYLIDNTLTSKTNFKIRLNNDYRINISLSNDINRFAQASVESVENILYNDKLVRSASWNTIKLYYASFFSIHSLMRLFGWSFVQLENLHINKIMEIAKITNMNGSINNLDNGFYLAKYDNKTSTIYFEKKKDSHKDAWDSFRELIEYLDNEIKNSPHVLNEEKIEIQDFISNIKDILTKEGNSCGNWLSSIRNKVNYQQSFGTWYPYGNIDYAKLLKDRNFDWRRDIDSFDLSISKPEIETLYIMTNLLVSLLYNLLKFNYELTDKKSKILTNGYFKLISLVDK